MSVMCLSDGSHWQNTRRRRVEYSWALYIFTVVKDKSVGVVETTVEVLGMYRMWFFTIQSELELDSSEHVSN